jgi:hypothetical protein
MCVLTAHLSRLLFSFSMLIMISAACTWSPTPPRIDPTEMQSVDQRLSMKGHATDTTHRIAAPQLAACGTMGAGRPVERGGRIRAVFRKRGVSVIFGVGLWSR